jgi:hypothetical protein
MYIQARQFPKSKQCIAALTAAPQLAANHAAALWLYICESLLYRTLNRLLRAQLRLSDGGPLPITCGGCLRRLPASQSRTPSHAWSTTESREASSAPTRICTSSRGGAYRAPRRISRHCRCDEQSRAIDRVARVRSHTTGADRPLLHNPMFLGSAGDRTIFQILTRCGIDISPFSAVRRAVRLVAHACVLVNVSEHLQVERWRSRACCRRTRAASQSSCEDDDDAPTLIS